MVARHAQALAAGRPFALVIADPGFEEGKVEAFLLALRRANPAVKVIITTPEPYLGEMPLPGRYLVLAILLVELCAMCKTCCATLDSKWEMVWQKTELDCSSQRQSLPCSHRRLASGGKRKPWD